MSDKTLPVEINPEGAGAQAGVKTEPKAPEVEIDLLDEFQSVLEENKKLVSERDNYKRIGLARKKGEVIPEDSDDIERRAEERAEEIVTQRLQAQNEAKAREIALKALKENRELKIALRNRNGITTTPSSTSITDDPKNKETFWTAEQIAYFKKRSIDPEKAKENYLRLKT